MLGGYLSGGEDPMVEELGWDPTLHHHVITNNHYDKIEAGPFGMASSDHIIGPIPHCLMNTRDHAHQSTLLTSQKRGRHARGQLVYGKRRHAENRDAGS